jgi:hypothetical protein
MPNITDLRILINRMETRMDDIVTILSMDKEIPFTTDELKEVDRRVTRVIQMYHNWRKHYDKTNQ